MATEYEFVEQEFFVSYIGQLREARERIAAKAKKRKAASGIKQAQKPLY